MELTVDRPIRWQEFQQARFNEIRRGDLILTDPVFGVEHVTSIATVELPLGEKVLRIGLESRSLAFPHLTGGSDARFVPRNIVRFPLEPTLRVHVVDAETGE